jgi:Phytanoyl-CoA dioxygenase (PhyH)
MIVNPDPVMTYGVTEQTSANSDLDLWRETFRRDGYVVLPDVFSEEHMRSISALIDQVYDAQVAEAGGSQFLESAKETDIARCPLAYDERFLDLSTNSVIHSFVRQVLGQNYVLLMQNAIVNRPQFENFQAHWHRDLNYQHWVNSRTLSLNFLICVDRFFSEGGATWVLPGSHLHEEFPSDSYVRTHEIPLEAAVGSVVVLDGMTFHRAGINSTGSYIRRAVNNVVGLPFMGQQIDLPRFLDTRGSDHRNDPFLARYLGYRWNPASDGREWRRKHAVPTSQASLPA